MCAARPDFTAKLADVGLAKLQHKDYLSAHQAVGTFTWSAPEVLLGERCTEKVDQFSFGVVLWEVVTGEKPARGRLRSVRCAPPPAPPAPRPHASGQAPSPLDASAGADAPHQSRALCGTLCGASWLEEVRAGRAR